MSEGLNYYGVVLDASDKNIDELIDILLIDEYARKEKIVAYRKDFKVDDFMIGDVVVYHVQGIHHVTQVRFKEKVALYGDFRTLLIDYFEFMTGQKNFTVAF